MDLNRLFSNTKFYQTAVLITAVFFVIVMFFWNPAEQKYYPDCIFKVITGLQCPGCGGLRGTHEIMHFNFTEAYSYNPLVFISTPVIFYAIIYFAAGLLFGVKIPKLTLTPLLATVISVIVLLFWFYRNM